MSNKITVLFVDDELNILQGLRRMFHSKRNEWEMYFALSGEEALNILLKFPIEVVISDMKMPGMDGAELLNRVQNHHPNTIRIILSGHSDEEMVLRATKSTHQFLAKPINSDILIDTVQKICSYRKLFNNEKLLEIISGSENLPSLPELYNKLLTELQSQDSSMKKVGDIICKDITMTAKILKFVNSAFFGLPKRISRPHEAVSMLGIDLIKSLIFSVGIFSTFKIPQNSRINLEELWKHSMMVGILAEKIFKNESTDLKIIEDVIIAGLLHDIGKLLMIKQENYFNKIESVIKDNNYLIHEAEHILYGTSHAEVGAYLLVLWGLPERIIEPVALHHSPSKSINDKFSILSAIHISNALFSMNKIPSDIESFHYLDYDYLKTIKAENKISEWKKIYSSLIQEK